MSTVNVQSAKDARAALGYALFGRGERVRQHLRDGTHRGALVTVNMLKTPGVVPVRGRAWAATHTDSMVRAAADFVARADAVQRRFPARKTAVFSYTQNFHPDEFSRDKPADVARVHELGGQLARKMNSADYVVVTHTDSAGGHVHNHIYVLNHDRLTGKALSRCTSWVHGLHQVNDELMREQGCWVLPDPQKQSQAVMDWDMRRDQFAAGGFEQELGDRIAAVLADPACVNRQVFEEKLADLGVSVTSTARDGLTYKMRRADNGKMGRRKASSLCAEFMEPALELMFDYHAQFGQARAGQNSAVRGLGGSGAISGHPGISATDVASQAAEDAVLEAFEARTPRAGKTKSLPREVTWDEQREQAVQERERAAREAEYAQRAARLQRQRELLSQGVGVDGAGLEMTDEYAWLGGLLEPIPGEMAGEGRDSAVKERGLERDVRPVDVVAAPTEEQTGKKAAKAASVLRRRRGTPAPAPSPVEPAELE